MLPKVSQRPLAEIIGTTCTHVKFFLNNLRKLGFIQYDVGLHINSSLLCIVLHDQRSTFAWRNVAVIRSLLYASTSNFRARNKAKKTRKCLHVDR